MATDSNNNQLDVNTLAQLEKVWGGRGKGEFSFGEGPDLQIRCNITPVTEKGLEPSSLGWAEDIHVTETLFGGNAVASTLFGRGNRRQVVLNTRLVKEIKELWSANKVCDSLLLIVQTFKS